MVGTQEQVLYLNPTIIFFIFNLMTMVGTQKLIAIVWQEVVSLRCEYLNSVLKSKDSLTE